MTRRGYYEISCKCNLQGTTRFVSYGMLSPVTIYQSTGRNTRRFGSSFILLRECKISHRLYQVMVTSNHSSNNNNNNNIWHILEAADTSRPSSWTRNPLTIPLIAAQRPLTAPRSAVLSSAFKNVCNNTMSLSQFNIPWRPWCPFSINATDTVTTQSRYTYRKNAITLQAPLKRYHATGTVAALSPYRHR
jgi:hypothetical protein